MGADDIKPHEFKPGQSGNPAGRPPEAPAYLKNYTKKAIAECVCKMLKMTLEEIARYVQNPEASSLEIIIGQVIQQCMKKGDYWALDKMLERVIGKVPLKQELSGPDGMPMIPPTFNIVPVRAIKPEETPNADGH